MHSGAVRFTPTEADVADVQRRGAAAAHKAAGSMAIRYSGDEVIDVVDLSARCLLGRVFVTIPPFAADASTVLISSSAKRLMFFMKKTNRFMSYELTGS